MRVVVLADTHLRRSWPNRRLPASVGAALAGADAVLHAGDVVEGHVLDELATHAPTWAVLGNNDDDLAGRLPEELVVELGGVRIGMVHDSGPRAGRPARLRRRFPDAGVVVFGHSHQPVNEMVDGQLLFNPGSPTERRREPRATYGVLHLRDGRIVEADIVPV